MQNFTFHNPTKIIFGQQKIADVASHIDINSHILFVYGGGSIKNNGVYQQVIESLKEHKVMEFSGVEPNPSVETLDKAVELVKKEGIDFILAVGGGSVIDGSKYIAAAACYEGDSWDILTGEHQVTKALTIGAVLTLPATGSESNAGAVVTRKATQEKMVFMSSAVYPAFAVLDPDVIKSLPKRQVANGLVDAFVHTCEQYLTYPCDAMVQDGYAEALLRALIKLANGFDQRDSDSWRANLMWSANQALNGLIGLGVAQDWATHMIGHELTAHYGLDHARTLAIIQPALLKNQIDYKREKLEQLGQNVFNLPASSDLAEKSITALEAFYHSVGISTRLGESVDYQQADIEVILTALNKHGMTSLGEKKNINLEVSREILLSAI